MKTKKTKRKSGLALMIMGAVLVFSAVALMLYNQWDESRAATAATEMAQTLLREIEERRETEEAQPNVWPDAATAIAPPDIEMASIVSNAAWQPMDSISVSDDKYIGVLTVPALDLDLPVMDEWSYPKLKKAPCRYWGSLSGNNLIIAAHNYRRHFGNISSLGTGDEVLFTDINGHVYKFTVAEIQTLGAADVSAMARSEYDLTLFTCTYGGQARVTVRCIRAV